MAYVRPTNPNPLTPNAKTDLLRQYGEFYRLLASNNPAELNKKLPRSALTASIDRIGAVILEESRALAANDAQVRQFVDENELPHMIKPLLPDDFRVFCLLLNALKQWIAAEQAATDRYLLGGRAREFCQQMLNLCLVTGDALVGKVDLHHPVRDGRPPIPLSEEGHRILERQTSSGERAEDDKPDEIARQIGAIKKPNQSWSMLRRGCRLLLDMAPGGGTPASNASAKSLARRVIAATGKTAPELIEWMDANERGLVTDPGRRDLPY